MRLKQQLARGVCVGSEVPFSFAWMFILFKYFIFFSLMMCLDKEGAMYLSSCLLKSSRF